MNVPPVDPVVSNAATDAAWVAPVPTRMALMVIALYSVEPLYVTIP